MYIENYINEIKKDHGDMFNLIHYNNYYRDILNDISILVKEIENGCELSLTNKNSIKELIIRLSNLYDLK